MLITCGCHLLAGSYDIGGTGGSGGEGGGTGGSGAEGGAEGGKGGEGPSLIEDGLVARYFLDDATEGTDPLQARDSGPAPLLNLDINYFDQELMWVTVDGNTGITWDNINSGTKLSTAIDGTKVADALQDVTAATLEIVARVDEARTEETCIFWVGSGADAGRFALVTPDLNTLRFRQGSTGTLWGEWTVDITSRTVYHVIVDTLQSTAPQRMRLFVDGVEQSNIASPLPMEGAMVGIGNSVDLVLGNREDGGRSLAGVLFYAAIYDRALGGDEIEANAAVLSTSDDTPPGG